MVTRRAYLLKLFPLTIAFWSKITDINQRAYIDGDYMPCM